MTTTTTQAIRMGERDGQAAREALRGDNEALLAWAVEATERANAARARGDESAFSRWYAAAQVAVR